MNIYSAGGAATNVSSAFAKYHKEKVPGFAEINAYYIDTSRSNLNTDISMDQVYLVDGVDGSGKKRASNYEVLSECSHEILHQFKPADINLVVHSAAGGTGSTIAPILVSELLSRDANVIVITIGSTASKIEIENTSKTLKSYELISQRRGMPVVCHYRENSTSVSRSQVDSEVQTAIILLAAMFSGDNRELDSADLKNFINYHLVTSYTPRLSMLEFFSKEIHLGKNQSLVSAVTLVDDVANSYITHPVEYQAVGYMPDSIKPSVSVEPPIHGCVLTGNFNAIVEALDSRLKDFGEVRKVVVERSIVAADVVSTDIGVIL
jgi:hypothetical protein